MIRPVIFQEQIDSGIFLLVIIQFSDLDKHPAIFPDFTPYAGHTALIHTSLKTSNLHESN